MQRSANGCLLVYHRLPSGQCASYSPHMCTAKEWRFDEKYTNLNGTQSKRTLAMDDLFIVALQVYISTSDVQMHASSHRKSSMMLEEGFQRFRPSEDCDTSDCPFQHERTTHFHCVRPGCNFTFKNKGDMGGSHLKQTRKHTICS